MASVTLNQPEDTIGTTEVVLTIEGREYRVGKLAFKGDFCDLYECTFSTPGLNATPGTWFDKLLEDEEGPITRGVVKIVRTQADNDLLANERDTLTRIYPPRAKDEKFFRYLPRLLESFSLPSGRLVNVFPWMEGYVPIAEVMGVFPQGIDFRDLAWMFKRLLVGIGFIHKSRAVHGAILPPHVLIHPTGHGAKILDWSFAVGPDTHIKGICGAFEAFYPPEVFDKQNAMPATDIYMAGKCAIALLGGDPKTNSMPDTVPAEIRSFMESCVIRSIRRRPQDAWDLHDEFDRTLHALVGKRKYRPFKMPEKN